MGESEPRFSRFFHRFLLLVLFTSVRSSLAEASRLPSKSSFSDSKWVALFSLRSTLSLNWCIPLVQSSWLLSFPSLSQPFSSPIHLDSSKVIGVRDQSSNHYDLMFGACPPNRPPYCLSQSGTCSDTSKPSGMCFSDSHSDAMSVQDSAFPSLKQSWAPVGGRFGNTGVISGEQACFLM